MTGAVRLGVPHGQETTQPSCHNRLGDAPFRLETQNNYGPVSPKPLRPKGQSRVLFFFVFKQRYFGTNGPASARQPQLKSHNSLGRAYRCRPICSQNDAGLHADVHR